jgi:excisionase family DNA binding protein
MNHPRTPDEPSDGNQPPQLDTPLLTPVEAAHLLAVKPSWVYEAVRAGTLPCLRIGRHIRLHRRDARGLAPGSGDLGGSFEARE